MVESIEKNTISLCSHIVPNMHKVITGTATNNYFLDYSINPSVYQLYKNNDNAHHSITKPKEYLFKLFSSTNSPKPRDNQFISGL